VKHGDDSILKHEVIHDIAVIFFERGEIEDVRMVARGGGREPSKAVKVRNMMSIGHRSRVLSLRLEYGTLCRAWYEKAAGIIMCPETRYDCYCVDGHSKPLAPTRSSVSLQERLSIQQAVSHTSDAVKLLTNCKSESIRLLANDTSESL
jgi:hypothetical protein